jgi:hypothetical protein
MLTDLRAAESSVVDLRPLKRPHGYGLAVSAELPSPADAEALAARLKNAVEKSAAHRAPDLLGSAWATLGSRTAPLLQMRVQTVEQPVKRYVSPITRGVNAVLALFDHAPHPEQKLIAVARSLRVIGQTPHVRVTDGGDDHSLAVAAIFAPDATRAGNIGDAVGLRLRIALSADDATAGRARAFYDRIETAAAAQRLTVAGPFISAAYVPIKYDYMAGYIWVLAVGLIGLALTFVFTRLESRGTIRKRGVEEAQAS